MPRETLVFRSVIRGALIGLVTLMGVLFAGSVLTTVSSNDRDPTPFIICFLIVVYGTTVSLRLCSTFLGNVAFVAIFWCSLLVISFVRESARRSPFSSDYWFSLIGFGVVHLTLQSVAYAMMKVSRRTDEMGESPDERIPERDADE